MCKASSQPWLEAAPSMRLTQKSRLRSFSLLAACALALSACAPGTPAPTATPLPTATAAASATPPVAVATVTPAAAQEFFPSGMAFDAAGNMYVSTCGGGPELVKLDASGRLTPIAGDGDGGFSGDGGPAL